MQINAVINAEMAAIALRRVMKATVGKILATRRFLCLKIFKNT